MKAQLYQHCKAYVQAKISAARAAMDEAQLAANNETKSSMGDKYETGRAMMQLEKQKHAQQLAEALKLKQVLDQIEPNKPCEQVGSGALAHTDTASYYFSISAGKIKQEEKTIFAISMASPIGQLLKGKKAGEQVNFRGKMIEILTIS